MKKYVVGLIISLFFTASFAESLNWMCYQSIVCKNQVCTGENGVGNFIIQPYTSSSKIPDGIYYFSNLTMQTPSSQPYCGYNTITVLSAQELILIATVQGTFNQNYYNGLAKINPNMKVINQKLNDGSTYSYIVCGYPPTGQNTNDNTACYFPPPPNAQIQASTQSQNKAISPPGTTLYLNATWDTNCSKCWKPAFGKPDNYDCQPSDCAVFGYYHCKSQQPALVLDNDPRLISLIKSGQCTYVPTTTMNYTDAKYVDKLSSCTSVLDRFAGRFYTPAQSKDDEKNHKAFTRLWFAVNFLGIKSGSQLLATYYDFGWGTQQDRKKATELYQIAANDNNAIAQYTMAIRLADGIGIKQNIPLAISTLQKVIKDHPAQATEEVNADVEMCAKLLLDRLNDHPK